MAQTASTSPKQTPPPPKSPGPFAFPAHQTRKLSNGMTLFVVEDHRLPLVSLTLDIPAGGSRDEAGKAGVASMTAALLREGTATRSSEDLSRLIDNAGGSLSASADEDTTTISATFMKSFTDLALELLADVVIHPKFDQEEIDRQMQQAQSGMQMQYSEVGYLANLVAGRAAFGRHPYAYPNEGTPATLRAITRADLVAFHRKYYAPTNAYLAIAGDITADEAVAKAEKYLGNWKVASPKMGALPGVEPTTRRVVVVDMPKAVQTQIYVGQVTVPRNHPDYVALNIANQVFGGSFNSRLNMKLRANEGLTYGANSIMHPLKEGGAWGVKTFTRTEKTADAVKMILDLITEWRANPATEAEFQEARGFMVGSFGLSVETSGAVAGRVVTAAVYGLGADYWSTYRQRLESFTRDQVAAAVQKHIKPESVAIVAVGNAAEFAKSLAVFGPVTLIQGDALDVMADDLRKAQPAAVYEAEGTAKAKQVVDAAIEAVGGLAALSRIKDLSSKGTLKMKSPQGEMVAETSEYVLLPDKYRVSMKLPFGEVIQGYDGATGWIGQGAVIKDLPPDLGKELAKGAMAASGVGLLVAAGEGKATVSLLAPVEVDGKPHHTVLWSLDGLQVRMLFDPVSKLLAKVSYTTAGMGGTVETDSVFGDYRVVDGVKLPFAETIFQNGQAAGQRSVTERKVNTGLTTERFKRPGGN